MDLKGYKIKKSTRTSISPLLKAKLMNIYIKVFKIVITIQNLTVITPNEHIKQIPKVYLLLVNYNTAEWFYSETQISKCF